MVYEKTASGIEEISGHHRRLTPKQRQVLILIDGKRTLEAIEKSLPRLMVAMIIDELETQGFIQNPNRPKKTSISVPQAVEHREISEQVMAETKNILIASTTQHLGLMGRAMTEQISSAASYEQLKTCISRWHMAIRESKGGHMIADELMSKVQLTLSSH